MTTPNDVPSVVTRYLAAADAQDPQAVADCFTVDGTVLDEGNTYTGRDEILGWRKRTISEWTYTTTISSGAPIGADAYRITARLEGDFPGGVAELRFDFTVRDGLIADLRIGA
jgi:hypothetical protein